MRKGKRQKEKGKSASKKSKVLGFLFTFAFLLFPFDLVCYAKEAAFTATVDRAKAGLAQPIQLDLSFEGTQNMPALELPALEGFQSEYLGPSTRISVMNGKAATSITHVYRLLPVKAGTFKLGPFKVEHEGGTYTSNAVNITVTEQQQAQTESGQVDVNNLNDRIRLEIQPGKAAAYLNETIPVTIKLYINRLGVRDIQYPKVGHEGFSMGEFEPAKQYQDATSGVVFDIAEFNTTIFGLRPGEFRIGPATLQCNLVVLNQRRRGPPAFEDFFNWSGFDEIFGGYEAYPLTLKSEEALITVLPLPHENKPRDFSGAIGDFEFEASVSPLEVKAGDPVTLKGAVRGLGNMNTVIVPSVRSSDEFKAYDPQARLEKNSKSFEQVIIPLKSGDKEVPALKFSFFDTNTGTYETVSRGPFPIKVSAPDKEEETRIIGAGRGSPPRSREEKFGRDIIFIKDSIGALNKQGACFYRNMVFRSLWILLLLVYLLLAAVRARSRKLKSDVKYARSLLAPRKAKAGILRSAAYLEKGDVRGFYDAVFQTLQEYLGDKFHLPSKGITISVIDERLRNTGVSSAVLAGLKNIFSECDMARYAASQLDKESMRKTFKKLQEAIDALQRIKT